MDIERGDDMKKVSLAFDLTNYKLNDEDKKNEDKIVYTLICNFFIAHQQQQQGYDIKQTRNMNKVLDKIENLTEFELEEAEFDFLCNVVENAKIVLTSTGARLRLDIFERLENAKLKEKK